MTSLPLGIVHMISIVGSKLPYICTPWDYSFVVLDRITRLQWQPPSTYNIKVSCNSVASSNSGLCSSTSRNESCSLKYLINELTGRLLKRRQTLHSSSYKASIYTPYNLYRQRIHHALPLGAPLSYSRTNTRLHYL